MQKNNIKKFDCLKKMLNLKTIIWSANLLTAFFATSLFVFIKIHQKVYGAHFINELFSFAYNNTFLSLLII